MLRTFSANSLSVLYKIRNFILYISVVIQALNFIHDNLKKPALVKPAGNLNMLRLSNRLNNASFFVFCTESLFVSFSVDFAGSCVFLNQSFRFKSILGGNHFLLPLVARG